MKKIVLLSVVFISMFVAEKANAQIDMGSISSKPSSQPVKDTAKKNQANKQVNNQQNQQQQQVASQQTNNQTQSVPPRFIYDTIVSKNAFNGKLYKSKIKNPSALQSESKERLEEVTMNPTNKVLSEAVLAYPDLREEDAVFNEFVWEEIDIRQKKNRIFDYKAYKQNGDQRFMAILLRIINEEKDLNGKPAVDIYSGGDGGDNFITPLTSKELDILFKGRLDTSKADPNDPSGTRKIQYKSAITPESIFKFQLKEQYIFDKKYGQLFRRVIGIAPIAMVPYDGPDLPVVDPKTNLIMKDKNGDDSTYTPGPSPKALFWISYPQLRKVLAKYNAYNPQNDAVAMTWSDVLDMGYFEANIVKSTMDNEDDLTIFEKFPANDEKSRIKRLEYANKIRQKLFDKEQDRWVY